MKGKTVSDEQKLAILNELDAGASAKELGRKHGVHISTFYNWRKKLGGLNMSDIKKLRALEDENRKLKRIVADLTLDITVLKDINSKKW